MYGYMTTSISSISVIYFCSIVVIGNFIILDLFLAVIIQSFSETAPEEGVSKEKLMALIKIIIAKKLTEKKVKSDSSLAKLDIG